MELLKKYLLYPAIIVLGIILFLSALFSNLIGGSRSFSPFQDVYRVYQYIVSSKDNNAKDTNPLTKDQFIAKLDEMDEEYIKNNPKQKVSKHLQGLITSIEKGPRIEKWVSATGDINTVTAYLDGPYIGKTYHLVIEATIPTQNNISYNVKMSDHNFDGILDEIVYTNSNESSDMHIFPNPSDESSLFIWNSALNQFIK